MKTKKKAAKAQRTHEDTTLAELLETVAPPREDTTGVHVVGLGETGHMLVIQGPESLRLTRLLLDYVEALHAHAEAKSVQ